MNGKIKRIAIIGNAGSGKSTLAWRLHTIFKLPVYHLDQYFWKPGWIFPNLDDYQVIHDELCDRDAWILDGMNLRLLQYRIERADIVIFLDIPRYKCFWRIFKRTLKYYGKETPSSAPGCCERFNGEFIRFLKWVWHFKSRYPERIREIVGDVMYEQSEKQFIVVRSQKEVDELVDALRKKHSL
jgi:adenylate kinase family enzyme